MKTKITFFLSLLFFITSCQTKEQKIEELIKDELFRTLYDFSSYEPIETKIDSGFTSIYRDSIIIAYAYLASQQLKNMDEYFKKVESAQSTYEIYSDSRSASGRLRRDRAKREWDRNLEKLYESLEKMESYYDIIREKADTFQIEFIGWQATHRFRTKTRGGSFAIGDNLYIFDPKLENLLYRESLDDEEIISLRNIIDEALGL